MGVTLERSKRIVIGQEVKEEDINQENRKLLKMYERDMSMRALSDKSIYNYKMDIMQ